MQRASSTEPPDVDQEEQDVDPFHQLFESRAEAMAGSTVGLSIEHLNLEPNVAGKARELQQLAPDVRFTSGRRDIAQQAHAMAGHVVHNRRWIAETYTSTHAIRLLQQWVDTHPGADTVDAIARGLAEVMNGMSAQQRMGISRHLTGRAFDIGPHTAPVAVINGLHPRQFLQREGGLVIWHVDF